MPVPFWSGKNAKTTFFRGDDKIILDDNSVSIKAYGTKAEDGVNGENRNRRQFILDGYEVSIEGKQQKLDVFKMWLEVQLDRDANVIEEPMAIGCLVQMNDGTTEAFQLINPTVDDWEIKWTGRSERNSYTFPLRCDDVQELPSL